VKQVLAILGLALLLAACQPQRPGVRVWTTGSVTAENLAVAEGGELRAGFYTATIRDDCSQVGKVSVRTPMEPVNGVLTLSDYLDFPVCAFRRQISACNAMAASFQVSLSPISQTRVSPARISSVWTSFGPTAIQ
jgi:hypothetical protein